MFLRARSALGLGGSLALRLGVAAAIGAALAVLCAPFAAGARATGRARARTRAPRRVVGLGPAGRARPECARHPRRRGRSRPRRGDRTRAERDVRCPRAGSRHDDSTGRRSTSPHVWSFRSAGHRRRARSWRSSRRSTRREPADSDGGFDEAEYLGRQGVHTILRAGRVPVRSDGAAASSASPTGCAAGSRRRWPLGSRANGGR